MSFLQILALSCLSLVGLIFIVIGNALSRKAGFEAGYHKAQIDISNNIRKNLGEMNLAQYAQKKAEEEKS